MSSSTRGISRWTKRDAFSVGRHPRASAGKSMRTNSLTTEARYSPQKSARLRRTTFCMRPRRDSMPSRGPRRSGYCCRRPRWSPISRSPTVGASLRPAFPSPSGPISTRTPGASPRNSRSHWRATTTAFSRRRPSSPRRSTRRTRSALGRTSGAWSPGSWRTSSYSGSRRTVTSDTGLAGTRSGSSSSEPRSWSAVPLRRRPPSFAGDGFFWATRIPERGSGMIARTWHGVTAASKADAYYEVLQESGLKEYRATPGNQGVIVLRRTEGDRTHFLLITFWESFDAIRRFAGPNPERAVYYPKDKEFLLEFEPTVTHYDVLLSQTDGDDEARRP